jgi:signal transduction histidine kinase
VGHLSYQTTAVPVSEVLARVEELVLPQFEAKGVRCTFCAQTADAGPGAAPMMVSADWDRVCQILLNVMSNAVKFTPPGGTVSVSTHSPAEKTVSISVSDTGDGISADDLDAVFEPFVQVGRTLSHPRDGVGLGLAISRELAQGMGGSLTVRSEIGVGSVFTLTLPTA